MEKSYHAPFIFGQPAIFKPAALVGHLQIDRCLGINHMMIEAGAAAVPGVIEPARFAREQSHVTGVLALTQLPRLAEVLFDHEGGVRYSVEGYTTAKGQPALHISLVADLGACCQRCLERLPLHLDVERDIVLLAGVRALDQADDDDDDTDAIPHAATLDLLDLIEEEVVLSLPMVPRHPDDGCSAQSAAEPGKPDSPFSVLAGLKTH
jgi:uncharacterized protein